MPKGLNTCNNIVNLYYRAEAIANIADNAASSPVTNIKVRLATASYTPSSTGSSNEATYTNYAAQDVARSASGWTSASGGATSNVAAIEFPQCGASGNTIHSACTSKGAGASDVFHYGDLNADIAVSNQIQPRFPIGAGRPKAECKSLASYGDWSDLCRQPLLWLGCPDPTESVFEAMAEDPDRETLSRLLHAWHATFGKVPAMVRDAVKEASMFQTQSSELREVLHDIAAERGEINRRKLGWWIRRHAGRIVDGLRIVRATGNGSAERWQIEVLEPVSPVSSLSIQPAGASVSGTADNYARASRGGSLALRS